MANAKEKICVNFRWEDYRLVFTDHANDRLDERWININDVKYSIEEFDINYQKYWKEIVEKKIKVGRIRTVFSIKTNRHIILITSMILWK